MHQSTTLIFLLSKKNDLQPTETQFSTTITSVSLLGPFLTTDSNKKVCLLNATEKKKKSKCLHVCISSWK